MKAPVAIAALFAGAVMVGCSDSQPPTSSELPEQPNPTVELAAFNGIVSEPVVVSGSATQGASRSLVRASVGQGVTYASLVPGSFPRSITIEIRNRASGFTVAKSLVQGGLDPVQVPASVGDTLEMVVTGDGGVSASFMAVVPPKRPPVIVRTEPPKKKIDVPLNAVVTVVFSEPVDPNTITPETIKLLLDGQPVDGTLTLIADGLFAVLRPAQLLAPGASYTLVITTGVADLAGDAPEQQVVVNFTTAQQQRAIAFQRFAVGTDVATSGIYRMNLDRPGLVRLADGGAPAWSPDGSKIAFSGYDGLLHVMNADGSGLVNLTSSPGVFSRPAWSPDGSKIAFTRVSDGNWEVYVINADRSGLTNLTNNTAFDAEPTWSADGSKIAFESDREGGNAKIYVMNADGSNVVSLNQQGGASAWSPDGSKIAFASVRDGNQEIYVMNADGTGAVNLTNDPAARDRWPAWSPDGTKIVFSSWRGQGFEFSPPLDIYVMNADGSDVVRITASDEWNDYHPHWRP